MHKRLMLAATLALSTSAATARSATIVQVHGQGPFAITYVNPADNPQAKSKP